MSIEIGLTFPFVVFLNVVFCTMMLSFAAQGHCKYDSVHSLLRQGVFPTVEKHNQNKKVAKIKSITLC